MIKALDPDRGLPGAPEAQFVAQMSRFVRFEEQNASAHIQLGPSAHLLIMTGGDTPAPKEKEPTP